MTTRRQALLDSVGFGLVGKATGFIIPLVVAARFGISSDTDALYLAMAVTQLLVTVFAQGLEQYLIPFYVAGAGPGETRVRLGWATRRATMASAAGWMLGLPLVWWLGSKAAAQTGPALPLLLYALLAPQIVCAAAGACRSALLMARGDFRWPALSISLRAAGVIGAVVFAPRSSGIAPLAVGFSLGELLRVTCLSMLVRRRLRGEAPGQAVTIPRETVARGLWQLGSVALLGVAPLIERSLAALVAPGGVTMLEYASKLFYIAATVFDTNFAAVFIRGWAVEARERRWTALQRDLRRWVGAVAVGATIIAVALIVVRTPVVHVVLARGQFGSNDIGRVAPLFAILLLAYPFAAIAMLLSGLVVALHETRLLFQVSVLKMVVRSVAALVLGLHWGLAGIAAALLCTHVAECAYLAAAGRRTIRARLAGASVLPTEEE